MPVQSRPKENAAKTPHAPGAEGELETIQSFNRRHCQGPILGCCFDSSNDILYGTLSHSHLLLVMLLLLNGGIWKVPDGMRKFFNHDGRWSFEKLIAENPNAEKLQTLGLHVVVYVLHNPETNLKAPASAADSSND